MKLGEIETIGYGQILSKVKISASDIILIKKFTETVPLKIPT